MKKNRHIFISLQTTTVLTQCVWALRYVAAESLKQKKWLLLVTLVTTQETQRTFQITLLHIAMLMQAGVNLDNV